MQSTRLWLALSLSIGGILGAAACVGDDPTTGAGTDDASTSGNDSSVVGDGAEPGTDGSSRTDSGVDSGPALTPFDPVAIAVGINHACALLLNHQVYCWGNNGEGELGPNSAALETATPIAIPFGAGVNPVSIFAGDNFSCAIDDTNRVWCWGSNVGYGLGNNNGDAGSFRVPGQVLNGSGNLLATSGSAGTYTGDPGACVVAADKTLQCWGSSTFQTYGVASTSKVATPPPVSTSTPALAISCSGIFCGGIVTNGGKATLATWGTNTSGELGVLDGGSFQTNPSYPVLPFTNPPAMIAVGTFHGCVVDTAGALACWGVNDTHAVGASASGSPIAPPVEDIDFQSDKVIGLAAGTGSTCTIIASGDVWCFGDNTYGQLGMSGGGNSAARKQVPSISHDAVAIAGSNTTYCVIRQGLVSGGRSVWCWGSNYEQELGATDAGSSCSGHACSPTPVKVALPAG